MKVFKSSKVYTQPIDPVEPVKLSTGQKMRSLLSGTVGKVAIRVEALQKEVTRQYTALGNMTVQLQNFGKVSQEDLVSFEKKLKTLEKQVSRLTSNVAKLSQKSKKTAKVKKLIKDLASLEQTIQSLSSGKRKTALVAASENKDLHNIAGRIEESRVLLQKAGKKTKMPLDPSWQLHQAVCEVEKLEKEPIGIEARKVVKNMKAQIEANKSSILQLTPQELKLKEGLLSGDRIPNKKNTIAISRLLAKTLVQADHFSVKKDQDVERLIQACQPAIAQSGKLKDLLVFHQIGKPIYEVMQHIDDALETGNPDMVLKACRVVPELLNHSRGAVEAVVYFTTQENAAYNGEIDNKDKRAELVISMWKKCLIDLSPDYHAKSELHVPTLQGILHIVKELRIEKTPICQTLLKAQRALEIEPKRKPARELTEKSMRKLGELHASMKQNMKDLAQMSPHSVSERTSQLVAMSILGFTNVLAQFNKEMHLEDIDAAFDSKLRPILQLRKEYVDAYKVAGSESKLNNCAKIFKVGSHEEFQELLYRLSSLIDALAKEKGKSVDITSAQQKLVTFMTGTLQELVKELLHNAPLDSDRRAILLEAYAAIQKVNLQISV
ncbi:MAG: hypothetical protein LLF94_06880 [Chlamydiales bacterium]|nr:hypothetical protein [Chlamydiales bacterium]